MKCIKEKCNYSQAIDGVGYCHEFDVYVWNDECKITTRLKESKNELAKNETIFNRVLTNQE